MLLDAQGRPMPQMSVPLNEEQEISSDTGRTLGGQVRNLRRRGQVAVGRGAQAAQDLLGNFLANHPNLGGYGRAGLALAGAVPAATTAMSELQQGRPTGALAALAPAGLSAIGAGMIGKTGPVGTAVGLGLMGLGAILPGAAAQGAEAARQKLTGEPTKGKEGEFATQMAMNRQMAELGTSQYRDQMGVYTSNIKDLTKFYADQDYYNLQRNMPLINQLKNADLTRQQALINTQGQNYAMLGALATAGQLATGAQAEAGANLRTALTSNPYAGSVLQAPSISYGR